MAQLRADAENKQGEPDKLIVAIVAATATVAGAVFGSLGFILGRGH